MMKPGSRDVFLLLTSMVLASVPVGYLQVVLPLYLNRAGLEPSVIGLLYSLSGLVTAGVFGLFGAPSPRVWRRGVPCFGGGPPGVVPLSFPPAPPPRPPAGGRPY